MRDRVLGPEVVIACTDSVMASPQTTMTEVRTDTQSSPSSLPPNNARPRATMIAGYILSLEEGARWANKVRNDPTRILPATVRLSPTVLDIIDEDFRRQGGIGVYYNIGDSSNEQASMRYLVTTQMKQGYWWNTTQETVERERVRDPEIRLEEGDADRHVFERLKENGINPTRFDCHFF